MCGHLVGLVGLRSMRPVGVNPHRWQAFCPLARWQDRVWRNETARDIRPARLPQRSCAALEDLMSSVHVSEVSPLFRVRLFGWLAAVLALALIAGLAAFLA